MQERLTAQFAKLADQRKNQFARACCWKHLPRAHCMAAEDNATPEALKKMAANFNHACIREHPDGKLEFELRGKVVETLEGYR